MFQPFECGNTQGGNNFLIYTIMPSNIVTLLIPISINEIHVQYSLGTLLFVDTEVHVVSSVLSSAWIEQVFYLSIIHLYSLDKIT